MKSARAVWRIVLPPFLVMGMLAISGRAGKPEGPSKSPVVSVTGGIEGEGDAAHMQVTFLESSFGDLAGTYVANPDGPLEVLGVRKGPRTLRYYYCDACSPDGLDCCGTAAHDPFHYYALIVHGGTLQGKGSDTQIVFPAGSEWEIRSKEPYGAVAASGQLAGPVTYRELD